MSETSPIDQPLPVNIEPAEVLCQDAVPEYEEGMGRFFNQLVRLNLNLAIIERILDFPADLFGVGLQTEASFLAITVFNTVEACILAITRVAKDDSGSDVQTLTRFKNRLGSQLLKPEYRKAFWKKLEVARFDQETQDLLETALELRNKDIAHLIPDPSLRRLTLEEIKVLRDRLNLLFRSLAFNAQYELVPLNYGDLASGQSDLDDILDGIAKCSKILHYPEARPELWPARRERLSPDELMHLNHYRKKFGLPEV